ncbi:MAG: transglutaminase family protein [Prevotella sp.]|nr:transglutaminase family protein [Candidatus Prevotella equi]
MFNPSIGQHNIQLRCLPARETFQKAVSETFTISECFWHGEGLDGFGNRIISGGTRERHATLEYICRGTIKQSTYCIPDAEPHPIFSLPSEERFDVLEDIISEAKALHGLDAPLAVMHYVHRFMTYRPGTTDINTSLRDVIAMRQGVCQDYAHLMVEICRKAGLPARYVCGLMIGEGATHAWVEVHDGQCWYAFDPTNDTAIATGYIKLAHGRNANDCPVSRGTYIGNTLQRTIVSVSVTFPQTTKQHKR